MPYNAKAIANFFLDLAESAGKRLSHLKLQKLVYLAHGWHLGLTGEPLLNEHVQAGGLGPFIRSLDNEFQDCGSEFITRRAHTIEFIGAANLLDMELNHPSIDDYKTEDNEYTKHLLQRIWARYDGCSESQLSTMTHAPSTPWDRVSNQYHGTIPENTIIPEECIGDYFKDQESSTTGSLMGDGGLRSSV